MIANDNLVQIGDGYFVHSTKRWETVDGDGQGAIIKGRATNRTFIVVADPDRIKVKCLRRCPRDAYAASVLLGHARVAKQALARQRNA
jgi:hypothetical protein